ncbi:unnamed protein product [Echinostoma caproni]|uniref:Beta-1,4-galactosyltransferase n=1 Tax=Echinostoma caproni TaxID=27848 RepID=A0A183AJ14_9TREM|nr:unnamed protein product [Echinostoma caproni]
MRECLSVPTITILVNALDPNALFTSRRKIRNSVRVLSYMFLVILMLIIYNASSDRLSASSNTEFTESAATQSERIQTHSTSPFTKLVWHTFYQFVDPQTLDIHPNATWFALSLFATDHEAMDPSIRNEHLEDQLLEQLRRENITIDMGGYYNPDNVMDMKNCNQVNRTLTIVVPYRKRAQNLLSFLSYMHRFLPLKAVRYRLVVLEQTSLKAFNRAKLFNAGLRELGLLIDEGKRPFTEDVTTRLNCTNYCFVLHDVDKLPVSMQTPYECHWNPLQLVRIGVARNKSAVMLGNIQLEKGKSEHWFYENFFGGVTVVNKRVLQRVNGMSNVFFGWGGEDDDFRARMTRRHIPVDLAPWNFSRFYFLDHAGDSPFNRRARTLLGGNRVWIRMNRDGMRQTRYTVRQRIVRPLYTLYQISV